ncbi:hypothetical protein ACFVU2_17850 [Leifsonia sp. NPDC058194]|uniref:hypothetical protein n=1 Tax=Leifsonia sp. NPDC058194 TaxID=3346374 RepID=UPI0036DC46AB
MANPLVASTVDTATPFSGAFLIEDGQSIVNAIQSGDWVEGGMAAFSAVLDTAAAIIDPIGTLIANGLGWVLDHIEPLKGWLNDITGSAGEVAAFAQTWENISGRMHASGDSFLRRTDDLDDLSGATIDAYLAFAADGAKHLHATGDWASAISSGLRMASTLVQIVHDLVRDAISQVVGTAISAATEMVLTVGLATPFVIGQVGTKVASLASRVGRTVTRLLSSFKSLSRVIDTLKDLFSRGAGLLSGMLHGERGGAAAARSDGLPGTAGRENPLSQETRDRITAIDKGSRPDPSTYLSPEYVDQHLHRFDDGATRFMTQSNLDKYGIAQRDGTAFVMPKSEVDALIRQTGGDPRAMEQALGLPDGFFDQGAVRVDVPAPGSQGLRVPSGNEAGANDQWIPGGILPGGFSEGVVDAGGLRPDQYGVSTLGGRKDHP